MQLVEPVRASVQTPRRRPDRTERAPAGPDSLKQHLTQRAEREQGDPGIQQPAGACVLETGPPQENDHEQKPGAECQAQVSGPAGHPEHEPRRVVACWGRHCTGYCAGSADREPERTGNRVRVIGADRPAHRVAPPRQPRGQRGSQLAAVLFHRGDRPGSDTPEVVVEDLDGVSRELDALPKGQRDAARRCGQDLSGARGAGLQLCVGGGRAAGHHQKSETDRQHGQNLAEDSR